MRIVKLSNEVYGFDTLEACKAYFRYVLPWQKHQFNIVGEGAHISPQKVNESKTLVFSYRGQIIAIGLLEEAVVQDQRVNAIVLKGDSVKVLEKKIGLRDLEDHLSQAGFTDSIANVQGWNIIEGDFEKKALDFIMRKEWADFV